MNVARRNRWIAAGAATTCALLLSFLTVFNQVKTLGLSWHEANYKARLDAIMAGEAPAPDQYRLLSNRPVAAAYGLAERLGVPRPVGTVMVAVRLFQNFILFLLALWYYRKLGIPLYAGLLGLSALAWGMTQSNYQSDLSIDAYTDMLVYLAAVLVLLSRRVGWLVPITLLGALNRETSGLIPLLPMALAYISGKTHVERIETSDPREASTQRLLRTGVVCLALYLAVCMGLRGHYGERPWLSGSLWPQPALAYNLGNPRTWMHLIGIWGLVPVLALISIHTWPPALRAVFWAVVPLWTGAHFLYSTVETGRAMLLPLLLAFVPGALCGLCAARRAGPGAQHP